MDSIVALLYALTATLALLFFATLPGRSHQSDKRDYVIYWATGQQLLHHGNPYDPAAVAKVEKAQGYLTQDTTMRNPPWSLVLVAPLGLFSPSAGSLPWSLLILSLVVVSVYLLWGLYGRPDNKRQWVGYCFPFALQCSMVGQTSAFILLGVVLFLRLRERHAFWAGAALWFCTLKPHLLLPFGVVLLAWVVIRRNWTLLSGFAAAMAASCLLTESIDPSAWTQYRNWAHSSGIAQEFIPTPSYFLQHLIAPAASWLTFVPCILACVGALIYFWRRRHTWDWLEGGGLLLLVSFLVAPYSWMYDQTVLLPALFGSAVRTTSRFLLAALGVAYLFIDVQPFLSVRLQWILNLWPPVFWLVWYVCVRKLRVAEPSGAAVCVQLPG